MILKLINVQTPTGEFNMRKCPRCGEELLEIIYGMPGSELFEASERGEVILGGCEVFEDGPDYHCKKCNLDYSRDLKKAFKPENDDAEF